MMHESVGGWFHFFSLHNFTAGLINKSPFIFANFNGTSGDVDVLTHEAGHALNSYLAKDIEISEYRSATMETCEVHSMSMEFFTMPWMKMNLSSKRADVGRLKPISTVPLFTILIIVWPKHALFNSEI
ncbi:MAG: M3 family metallopeptidase [Acetivibrionales bacterium]|jgi:oligoendopeptidase F